jgi:hypothetical protein
MLAYLVLRQFAPSYAAMIEDRTTLSGFDVFESPRRGVFGVARPSEHGSGAAMHECPGLTTSPQASFVRAASELARAEKGPPRPEDFKIAIDFRG